MKSGDGEALEWVRQNSHDWKVGCLAVPGPASLPPAYLAVFHRFHTCESDGDHVFTIVAPDAPARGDWRLGAEIPETATLGIRIRDHAIAARIEVASRTAILRDKLEIEREKASTVADQPMPFALLRLNENYHVRGLSQSESSKPSPFSQVGGVVAFVPPAADRFSLAVDYTGKLDYRNGDYIHDDEAVIASYWYPHVARLPATLTVAATSPIGWTSIAQGEPVAARHNADGTETLTWRNDIPTSYFTLDMGQYRVVTRQWKGKTLLTYMLESERTAARTSRDSLDLLQECMEFYEKSFGPYPYRRYAIVETRGPFTGALEAYSFATFGPQTLPDFIPHELAHTWWGGILPCTYTRSMWNEAFANYSDDLFRRSTTDRRRAAEANAISAARRRAERSRSSRAYSTLEVAKAFDTEDDLQNAVGYEKGAQVLRVLEEEIGQPAMLASMRALLANHASGAPVDWNDFNLAVNQSTGKDMRWFFEQWLERKGAPILQLTDVSARNSGTGTILEGHIRQVGDPYRVKLPVTVELRLGASVQQIVEIRGAETPFTIRLNERPDRIRVDPDALVPLGLTPADAQNKRDPLTYQFP